FAFRDPAKLSGSVRDMLDRCMEANMAISPKQAKQLAGEFLARLDLARSVFGEHAFKYKDKKGHWKSSQPLFDGLMIAIDQLWDRRRKIESHKAKVRTAVSSLLAQE